MGLELRRWGVHALASPRLRIALLVAAFLYSSAKAWWVRRRRESCRRFLALSSPLDGSSWRLGRPWPKFGGKFGGSRLGWSGFCPCCRRPINAELSGKQAFVPKPVQPPARLGNFAFVICLWGDSAEYVLGALILGHSLRRTGSRHSLVCLHTDDVPRGFVKLLRLVWDCREVRHVEVTQTLAFEDQAHRFAKVFTKLRVMQLVDFEKILILDIDTVVLNSIDHLFKLPAPAAMRRGMNESHTKDFHFRHGCPIDGSKFFEGKDWKSATMGQGDWGWGMATGINAGAMLLQPDEGVFQEMISELNEPNHPSHIRSNGPEQDYLSRFYAGAPWTHIGVENNYQVHQMFFALQPQRTACAERAMLLRTPEHINMVHFSGSSLAKPWQRILHERYTSLWPDRRRDEEYLELFAGEFAGYWLWVVRDPERWGRMSTWKGPKGRLDMDTEGMFLGDDGLIYRGRPDEPGDLVNIPQDLVDGSMTLLRRALTTWFDIFQDLELVLGLNLRYELQQVEGQTPVVQAVAAAAGRGDEGATAAFGGGSYNGVARKRDDGSRSKGAERWQVSRRGAAAVVCGGAAGGGTRFVRFVEAGQQTLEVDDERLVGLFLKVVGADEEYRMRWDDGEVADDPLCSVRCNGVDHKATWNEALASLRRWAAEVRPGASLCLAAVRLPAGRLAQCLQLLQPLGTPAVLPAAGAGGAVAALLRAGGAGGRAAGTCLSSHASPDVATVCV